MKDSFDKTKVYCLNAKRAEYPHAEQLRLKMIECLDINPTCSPIYFVSYLGFIDIKDFFSYKKEDKNFEHLRAVFVESLPKESQEFLYAKIREKKKRPEQSGCAISRKIKTNTYIRLNQAVRRKHNKKTNQSFIETFGYHQDDLKKHLESKFNNGMNWDNYGINGWHIDHIKPVSWFDFTDIESAIKECWALNNLQPMWGQLNSMKGNRYEG